MLNRHVARHEDEKKTTLIECMFLPCSFENKAQKSYLNVQ